MKRFYIPRFVRRVTPWGDGLRIELSYAEGEAPQFPPSQRKVGPVRVVLKMVQSLFGRKI